MYDNEEEFENIKERYESIAKGDIPDNIEKIKLQENNINICDLLVKIGYASSKSEAKRMITGNGVKIDGKTVEDYNIIIDLNHNKVIQFGKNRFIEVIK